MLINVSEKSPLFINFDEVVSISQQNHDVRIEMNCFGEQKFVLNATVSDFFSSLPKAVAEQFCKISESECALHVRPSAILSIGKQQHTASEINTRLTLSGKHHHVIFDINASQFFEKYIAA